MRIADDRGYAGARAARPSSALVEAHGMEGQNAVHSAPCQGRLHLRGRRRLHRVEDQPACTSRYPPQTLAAAAPPSGRDQPLAPPAEERGGALVRARAAATALARAPTVNGLRSSS